MNATASAMQRSEASRAAGAPPSVRMPLAIAPEVLADIERSLSRHVGPLAPVLLKKSQSEARTIEDFFRALAEHVPEGDEQQAFMKKMATVKSAVSTQPIATPTKTQATAARPERHHFTPEVLAMAEKSLASYVGPLARVLIKEAAGKSGNLKELYAQLAAHIDSEEERRAFLASLQ